MQECDSTDLFECMTYAIDGKTEGGIEAGLAIMVAIPNSYCRKSDTIITTAVTGRVFNGLDVIMNILSATCVYS